MTSESSFKNNKNRGEKSSKTLKLKADKQLQHNCKRKFFQEANPVELKGLIMNSSCM